MDTAAVDTYIDDNVDSFLADLRSLVARPSVSATGEGIEDCARALRSCCLEYGFDTADVVETAGHPAVLARAFVDHDPDNDAPTALVYGHYDVQPVEPDAWEHPPFDPTVRVVDGERLLYGRGTVDNKGQFFTYLCAVRALRETGGLPANVVLLLDGEEESGSPNLRDAVERREAELRAADVAVNSDGPVDESGRPTVVFGNRGILVVEIEVDGPDGDRHSGHYGGGIPNPVWELVGLLATMKDESGRITVDGFYDDVEPVPERGRELLDRFEPDPEALRERLGVEGLQGGPGESFLERTLYYPTLNINGIEGGHGEEGFKTIVPDGASATLDARLVVDQDPDDVFEAIRRHVANHAPENLSTTVSRHASMDPARTPLDTRFREPVVNAVADGWGEEPLVKPSTGGSAPYALFTDHLELPHVSVPYGQPDNNQHSPDEHFSLDHFERGLRTSARLLAAVADAR